LYDPGKDWGNIAVPEVIAVCTSEEKGTPKRDIRRARLIEDFGLEGDAHAGTGRQVSLLAWESVERLGVDDPAIRHGAFAENLTLRGLEVKDLAIGNTLRVGSLVLLEITQIGKQCHTSCAIRQIIGDCVMPREGAFARVIKGGMVQVGDQVRLVENEE
jgi:molybdopterin adenylyltransferase